MSSSQVSNAAIIRVNDKDAGENADFLAVEEPLEIRLLYGSAANRRTEAISVTMRTPGHDEELAAGFLFTENILSNVGDISDFLSFSCREEKSNTITIVLHETVNPDLERLKRNFYTTSSCGVCGKSSIEAVKTVINRHAEPDDLRLPASYFHQLPQLLRAQQQTFEHTGGLHASALFDTDANLLALREDVGRHNALDKLIGRFFLDGKTPLSHHVLLLSGRASFELIQKAAVAGIKIVAAVGAPSSLAVSLAADCGITLLGFLRDRRFNIYSRRDRVIV